MASEPYNQAYQKPKALRPAGASDAIYALGLLGAWVYFFSHVTTFWQGVLAFFQGVFWPAFMVYEAFKVLYGG
jgi:hypothetical protein